MALIFTCFFFLLLQDGPETVRPKWSTALRPAKGGAPRGGSRGRSKSLQPDYGAEGASRGLSCFLCVCVFVGSFVGCLFSLDLCTDLGRFNTLLPTLTKEYSLFNLQN